MFVAILLLPLLAFGATRPKIPLKDFVITYIQDCTKIFKLEGSSVISDNKGHFNDAIQRRKTFIEKILPSLDLYSKVLHSKTFTILKTLAKITFSSTVEAEYKRLGMDVSLATNNMLNSLPAMFDHFRERIGVKADTLRGELYLCIFVHGSNFDLRVDLLLKDFVKHLIMTTDRQVHDQLTFPALFGGLSANSKNAVLYWKMLYTHIVYTLNEGEESFDKSFVTVYRKWQEHRRILRNRKEVSVSLPEFTTVQDFVHDTIIETDKKGNIDVVPYVYYYQQRFDDHLKDLHKAGKIHPHPVTGKVLFSKTLSKSEVTHLIKLFKVMVCMNLYLPRLALTQEEYDLANQIENKFKYDSRLERQLLTLTNDITAHYDNFNVSFKSEGVFETLLAKNAELRHQVVFLASGFFIGGGTVEFKVLPTDSDRCILITRNKTAIFVNPSLTENDCEFLLKNMKRLSDDDVHAYFARLSTVENSTDTAVESVDIPAEPKTCSSSATDTETMPSENSPAVAVSVDKQESEKCENGEILSGVADIEPEIRKVPANRSDEPSSDSIVESSASDSDDEQEIHVDPDHIKTPSSTHNTDLDFIRAQTKLLRSDPIFSQNHIHIASQVADLQSRFEHAASVEHFCEILSDVARNATMQYDFGEKAMQFMVPAVDIRGIEYSLPIRVQLPRLEL